MHLCNFKVHVIEDGTIVVNNEGLIEAVGSDAEINKRFANCTFDLDIDASGKVVVPGTL